MSRWGMGMTSSDEFMDVYESFMERYDNGENTGRAGLYLDNELGIGFCENVGVDWNGSGNHFTYPGMYLRDFLNAENVPVKFVNQLQLKQMIQNAKKGNNGQTYMVYGE